MTTYIQPLEHGGDGWHMTAMTGSSKGAWPIGNCRPEYDRGEYHATAAEARECWNDYRAQIAADQALEAPMRDDEQRRCSLPECGEWTQRKVSVADPYCWDVWWLCDDHLDAASIREAIASAEQPITTQEDGDV